MAENEVKEVEQEEVVEETEKVEENVGPILYRGGLAIDDRGQLAFVNDFTFDGVKRFYTMMNHRSGFVRAWHAHKDEEQYITVVSGVALIGVVKLDNFDRPSPDLRPQKYVLSASKPAILYLPVGHAIGIKTLKDDTIVICYSTKTIEESKEDDYRFPMKYWNCWGIRER